MLPVYTQLAAPLEGAHGMRSRFLPVEQLDDETFTPRIVQLAGALGDVTVADIMAVGFTPSPEMGMWQYDFSDPGGPQVRSLLAFLHVWRRDSVIVVLCAYRVLLLV